MDDLTKRINYAVESILENERLTADLDDEAAQELIDWGITCVKKIVQSTSGLSDAEAEEITSPRLRATRRMMREVDRWVVRQSREDATASTKSLDRIIEQATIIYGDDFNPPDQDRHDTFSSQSLNVDDPQQMIAYLRAFIESGPESQTTQ